MPVSILKSIQNLFTRNLILKVLSLALALCIWSFTAISRETRYELILPVELRNIPSGYSLATQPPPAVHFTLSGPSIMIDGARRSNSAVILSLRDAVTPGRTDFSHMESHLKLPEGVRVTRISPALLEINLIQTARHQPESEQQQ